MTIYYALTRGEIVRGFLRSLGSSTKYLAIILLYASGMAVFTLAITGAFSRPLTLGDAVIAIAAAVGFILLLPIVLFIRGKTSTRSLTVSPEGISTEIGALRALIPWQKVKVISVTAHCILVARVNGNAFFIPDRAFSSPEHKIEFVNKIKNWTNITEVA